MDSSKSSDSGFSPHILEQLQQASRQLARGQSTERGRGVGRGRGRGYDSGRGSELGYHLNPHPQGQGQISRLPSDEPQSGFTAQRDRHQSWQQQRLPHQSTANSQADGFAVSLTIPKNLHSVSPLVPQSTPNLLRHQSSQTQGNIAQTTSMQDHLAQQPAKPLLERTRGNVHRGGPRLQHQTHRPQDPVQSGMMSPRNFQRPQTQNSQLYNPSQNATQVPHKQFREIIMQQSDYLNSVAAGALKQQISRAELEEKEGFRKRLESITRQVIANYSKPSNIDPNGVVLKCYGSLANGFGVRGSDMDLLLVFPNNKETIGDIELRSRRLMEKAFLDIGYGARLLTNTRVPILRVCQKPSVELLENLRKNREMWEEEIASEADAKNIGSNRLPEALSAEQADVAARVFAELEDAPQDIALPASPPREHANLDYDGDCGIQCDINFSNFVAIHNTKLLRCYGQFDTRVREMGLFVKTWSKARNINTPYHGTLSSYGYILMVLHYLMNIANPPLIPNLQHMARDEDAWANRTEIPLFEGFDIRFISDPRKIEQAKDGMRRNHESLGSLLRGFFWYYGDIQGFHWTQQVISIRTKGGLLKKFQKGWTEAKRAEGNNSIRLRFLLAIEDPFEVDHNIGRTVGHNGLVAIRDEFRRAWKIIQAAERSASGWQWRNNRGKNSEDFMEPVKDRGDLHRKDQEYHHQKLAQMRQDMEAKAKALKLGGDAEAQDCSNQETAENATGMSSDPDSHRTTEQANGNDRSNSKLTQRVGDFQGLRRKLNGRVRKLRSESDDEDATMVNTTGSGSVCSVVAKTSAEELAKEGNRSSHVNDELQRSAEAVILSEQVLYAHGLDPDGNPIAWDTTTQDGRWLRWRDVKIEKGTWQGVDNAYNRELDKQYPYNSFRPPPDPVSFMRKEVVSPPWPMNANATGGVQFRPGKQEIVDKKVATGGQVLKPPVVSLTEKLQVAWDRQTRGGGWLSWRDRKIRAGDFRQVREGKFAQLNQTFPYNPAISDEEVDLRNEILRAYYNAQYQVPDDVYNDLVLPALRGECKSLGPQEHRQGKGPILIQLNDPSESASAMVQTEPSVAEDSIDIDREPDPQFVRNQRLVYFSKMTLPEESANIHPSVKPGPNVETLMEAVGIRVEDGKAVKNDSSTIVVESDKRRRKKQRKKKFRRKSDRSSIDPPLILTNRGSSAESEPELVDTASAPSSVCGPQVPSTLFPDMSDEVRPRDEDPQIMPIPRSLGFQFDPHQLRDLGIIREGGNGCAREGQEYDIEDEYEWGGGGLMGWQKSSCGPVAFACGSDAGAPKWVAGTGDEDGLLGELPGFV